MQLNDPAHPIDYVVFVLLGISSSVGATLSPTEEQASDRHQLDMSSSSFSSPLSRVIQCFGRRTCHHRQYVRKILRSFFSSVNTSWVERETLQTFTMIIIAVSAVKMGVEADIEYVMWHWLEQVILDIFVFELAVRLKENRSAFFLPRHWLRNW